MQGVSSELHLDAKIWPLPQLSPDVELALDAKLAIPCSRNSGPVPRAAVALLHDRLPSHIMRLLDVLDQNMYGPYDPASRQHLSAPRYEDEYRGLSIVGLLKANREQEAYALISKDVALSTRIEQA